MNIAEGKKVVNVSSEDTEGFYLKEPGSAITHFIGFILAILFTPPLLANSLEDDIGYIPLLCNGVFMASAMLLYGASSAYHALDISQRVNTLLKKLDHMMVSVLIAGTYTPVCVIGLSGTVGKTLLIMVWSLALISILFKALWINCPKWVSSVIYIGMGWSCIYAMPQLVEMLPPAGFLWLLAGGISYTVGGVIYALKLSAFNNRFRHFGSHEIFHLFVMAGTVCHYVFVYWYL